MIKAHQPKAAIASGPEDRALAAQRAEGGPDVCATDLRGVAANDDDFARWQLAHETRQLLAEIARALGNFATAEKGRGRSIRRQAEPERPERVLVERPAEARQG